MKEYWPNICEALGSITMMTTTTIPPPHTTNYIFEMVVLRFRSLKSHMDVV